MTCYLCGAQLKNIVTDLPFKIAHDSIVIVRDLPILQCQNCHEFLIEDPIMERVDHILQTTDRASELEVLKFAI